MAPRTKRPANRHRRATAYLAAFRKAISFDLPGAAPDLELVESAEEGFVEVWASTFPKVSVVPPFPPRRYLLAFVGHKDSIRVIYLIGPVHVPSVKRAVARRALALLNAEWWAFGSGYLRDEGAYFSSSTIVRAPEQLTWMLLHELQNGTVPAREFCREIDVQLTPPIEYDSRTSAERLRDLRFGWSMRGTGDR